MAGQTLVRIKNSISWLEPSCLCANKRELYSWQAAYKLCLRHCFSQISNSHRTFGTGSSTCIRAQAVPVHVKLRVKHTNILDLLVKLFPVRRHIVKKPEKHLAALAPAGATWDILALLDIIYLGIWQQSYRLSKQIDCHWMTLDSVTKFVPQHPLTTGSTSASFMCGLKLGKLTSDLAFIGYY